jgi:phosphatidylinositol alpha 1,6-mannosyltransferase
VVVGYVGRLAKEKQIHRLAPVTRLPGVKVVIVGDGPERARLERALPQATFVGFRSGAELSQFHASFDVFAHTGLDETFCQAVQEALASAVPVVAPAAGGPIDLVRHGVNGYLWSPEQPEMLAGAVAELAGDAQLRRTLGHQGRAGVEQRPWSTVMAELVERYRDVIAGTSTFTTTPIRHHRPADVEVA